MSESIRTSPAESSLKLSRNTPWYRSLVGKQAIIVAIVVLIVSQSLSWGGYYFAREALRERVHHQVSAIGHERRDHIRSFVKQQHERAALVASRTRFRELITQFYEGTIEKEEFQTETFRTLSDANQSTESFIDIWFANLQGEVITATNSKYLGTKVSHEPAFQEGLQRAHVERPAQENENYRAVLSAPARDREGQVLGVVMVKVDMNPLVDILTEQSGLGETGEVFVGSISVNFQDFESPEVEPLLPTRMEQVQAMQTDALPMILAMEDEGGFNQIEYQGEEVLIQFLPVEYNSPETLFWGIVAKMDVDEAYEPMSRCGD